LELTHAGRPYELTLLVSTVLVYINMIYRSAPFSMTLVTPNPEVTPISDTKHLSSLTVKYKKKHLQWTMKRNLYAVNVAISNDLQ